MSKSQKIHRYATVNFFKLQYVPAEQPNWSWIIMLVRHNSQCSRSGVKGTTEASHEIHTGRGWFPSLFSWSASLRPGSLQPCFEHVKCRCLVVKTSRVGLERAGIWLLVRDKSHEIRNI
jgi:hypothetical protein